MNKSSFVEDYGLVKGFCNGVMEIAAYDSKVLGDFTAAPIR